MLERAISLFLSPSQMPNSSRNTLMGAPRKTFTQIARQLSPNSYKIKLPHMELTPSAVARSLAQGLPGGYQPCGNRGCAISSHF